MIVVASNVTRAAELQPAAVAPSDDTTTSTASTAAAGWFPDPDRPSEFRFFDGENWTGTEDTAIGGSFTLLPGANLTVFDSKAGIDGGAAGPKAKFVIASDPKSGRPPFVVEGIPQFVETRGGEYFFVPSMTALRMIGMGVVDPT